MNGWLYGWEFWLWMCPLLLVCFALIFAGGYLAMQCLDHLMDAITEEEE